ncbi:MAG: gluconokinase [Candidatus Anaerobiospirillum pullicola]|uniref:Gluconokinase n=1 Tax=Candidatus Anaerobiospirillum pullicola TaxID=2838451 RepID=A0A948TG55_9GAMM|nr:gluconokinase [Candidatus Anaerobiospirillum pullicola]
MSAAIKCVVMGVCGSGKTSVGKALAQHFAATFIDGDDLHPRANILKMASGHPLNDEDRAPWLERIGDVFFSLQRRSLSGVIVCSALKKSYRDIIRKDNEGLVFVHLVGSMDTILERMAARQGHYMKKDMVQSQFDTLEVPGPEETDVVSVSIEQPLDKVIAEAIAAVEKKLQA